MSVAVFHRIGEPTEDKFCHSIDQILAFDGQITFDGAYESVYEHREELKDKDIIVFIQATTIGKEGVMSLSQIHELGIRYGFHIGWHGWSHRKLTELPDHAVIAELSPPKEWNVLPIYAYPHGDFDDRTINLVKQMGYLQAYSTTQGEESNDYAIRRIYI